ncbi:MAG: transcriptional repressor [Fusicatenibacter sp.]|nr:transcriptional repressor [Fusicatenibacter sp.]
MHRHDHPTADMVYTDVRKEFPNISLGTVYRNLSLLSELGEIKRLATGDGPDRFDGITSPHNHFICRQCHSVEDLPMEDISEIKEKAGQNFDGFIEDYSVNFYGVCSNCRKKTL